ncbi:MAG: hypothetical protein A2277_02430 [Desulfobacterales bacterium RIFOXYA12_FULL_46_15]|nr:MAG: hypothetical protein A2277_02430 [Desulfobacterales bacterium RIFOXYA12_FULL_46_15]
MVYDPEKYREKREKVLGIKKRGIGFGTLAVIVSLVVITGLSIATVPQAVSYISTRNLDDAIFKLESGTSWPDSIIPEMTVVEGVKAAVKDKNDTRLVVTYDRRKATVYSIKAYFDQKGLDAVLLNEVNHRQHLTISKAEEEEIETP